MLKNAESKHDIKWGHLVENVTELRTYPGM